MSRKSCDLEWGLLDNIEGAILEYQGSFGAYGCEIYGSDFTTSHEGLLGCIEEARGLLGRYGLYNDILDAVSTSRSLYERGLTDEAYDVMMIFLKRMNLATGKYSAYSK